MSEQSEVSSGGHTSEGGASAVGAPLAAATADSSAMADWWGSADARFNPARVQAPAQPASSRHPAGGLGAAPGVPSPGRSPNGYGDDSPSPGLSAPGRTAAVSSLTPPILVLLVGAVMLFVGSIGPWATASVGPISINVSGTTNGVSQSYGVNGWVTFALGMTLVILAILEVVSRDATLRSVAVLVSFIALGFAIYFFSRVVHDIASAQPHQSLFPIANVDVGWGVVVLLIGAVGVFAGSVSAARSA